MEEGGEIIIVQRERERWIERGEVRKRRREGKEESVVQLRRQQRRA